MRTATLKVTVESVEGIKDEEDGSVTVERDALRLPEAYPAGSYITPDTTYAWTIGTEECRLHVVREAVSGTDLTTDRGEVFSSDEQTLVRLMKRTAVGLCGAQVWATNFPQAYLADPADLGHFGKGLHMREHSQMLYSNIQDAYILNYLRQYTHESISQALRSECVHRKRGREWQLADRIARQMAVSHGGLARLDGNRFVRAAGEAFALFECRETTVDIRETNRCYSVVPVQPNPVEVEKYRRLRGMEPHQPDPEFFMEPRSRLLITTAVEEPCAELVRPVYRNDHGYWISAGDRLSLASSPNEVQQEARGRGMETISETDFTSSGWYTPESVRNLDRYQMLPFATTAIARRVAGQAVYSGGSGMEPVSGSSIFPDVSRLNDLWPNLNPLAWIWGLLQRWGSVVSTFMGIYVLVRILSWGFWVALRLATPRVAGASLGGHVMSALFPGLKDLRNQEDGRTHPWTRAWSKRRQRRARKGSAIPHKGLEEAEGGAEGRFRVFDGELTLDQLNRSAHYHDFGAASAPVPAQRTQPHAAPLVQIARAAREALGGQHRPVQPLGSSTPKLPAKRAADDPLPRRDEGDDTIYENEPRPGDGQA